MGTKMKKMLNGAALLAVFACAVVAANEVDERGGISIGVDGGTLGLGISAGYDLPGAPLVVRGRYGRFDYGFDRQVSGNEFEGDLELQQFGMLLDWFPVGGGGFRVTGGVLWNGNAFVASSNSSNLDIGEARYSGTLNVDLELGDGAAPYLGVGWRSRQNSGFGFFVDAGVLLQGTPSVSASGSLAASGFGTCGFTVSNDGAVDLSGALCDRAMGLTTDLVRNLQTEHEALGDDLSDLEIWPVVLVGVSWTP